MYVVRFGLQPEMNDMKALFDINIPDDTPQHLVDQFNQIMKNIHNNKDSWWFTVGGVSVEELVDFYSEDKE